MMGLAGTVFTVWLVLFGIPKWIKFMEKENRKARGLDYAPIRRTHRVKVKRR